MKIMSYLYFNNEVHSKNSSRYFTSSNVKLHRIKSTLVITMLIINNPNLNTLTSLITNQIQGNNSDNHQIGKLGKIYTYVIRLLASIFKLYLNQLKSLFNEYFISLTCPYKKFLLKSKS